MPEIVQITSRDNARLKDAKRVRDGKVHDRIFIEGVRLVEEAVRSNVELDCVFVSDEGDDRASAVIENAPTANIYRLSNAGFKSISDTVTSQGLAAIARRPSPGPTHVEERLTNGSSPVVVFLYEINNPSNLGAVVRTAEAAGAAGVILSSGSADAFSPKALRSSMGSGFRVPIWEDVNLNDALKWARSNDLKTVATQAAAGSPYTELDWTLPRMILLGSEAHGLPSEEIKKADDRISIPMESQVESLNLAVACGVVLFEARRQRVAAQRIG